MGVQRFGFIDRVVARVVHLFSGVSLDRSPIPEEQTTPPTDNIGNVPQRSTTRRVQGGGPAESGVNGVSSEQRFERALYRDGFEDFATTQTAYS